MFVIEAATKAFWPLPFSAIRRARASKSAKSRFTFSAANFLASSGGTGSNLYALASNIIAQIIPHMIRKSRIMPSIARPKTPVRPSALLRCNAIVPTTSPPNHMMKQTVVTIGSISPITVLICHCGIRVASNAAMTVQVVAKTSRPAKGDHSVSMANRWEIGFRGEEGDESAGVPEEPESVGGVISTELAIAVSPRSGPGFGCCETKPRNCGPGGEGGLLPSRQSPAYL